MNPFKFSVDMFGDSDPQLMPMHFFFGARRLMYATAQRADPTRQNYTVAPRHWYITAVICCVNCGQDFTFSASEQRFWYEDLKFYVDSFPNRCPARRKYERHVLQIKQEYDSAIANALGPCSLEVKKRAFDLINQLESLEYGLPEQVKRNRTVLAAQIRNLEKA